MFLYCSVSLAQFTYASDNCVDVGLHNAELSVHSHNSDTFSVYVDNDVRFIMTLFVLSNLS